MGCPDIYYGRFVREADRLITYSRNTDKVTSLEEIEQRISGHKHNSDFYFNCGIAAANVMYSVQKEEGVDAFNAALGGLSEFESLIGNNDEDFGDAYDKQIAKPVNELKVYTTVEGYKYLLSANCPSCNKNLGVAYDYCPNCGQHLEWDSNRRCGDDIENLFQQKKVRNNYVST